ncbi:MULTISPECIES: MarR family winged helix-turn-helix transcriptional regulator [Desulfofundulus]|uniref:MarR family transcriptional regulator, 2-MHQ and catechol-resistance regulon repressor n=2 Tax=Desulfofundulus TaxID=2282741 RepID=A0A1M6BPU9_9FIRM|nr:MULTISPECIES: MarR family transcriptional regulator [Desulfofundulus]MDQ0285787.1 MarR family 2-MHQ and catechol resistance regulon transcriptional repressor [Desulfofundulus luciae]SHI50810.1 MarR family transcriptional regulator, 2-MHQ and catechol-resistance regulon repressor [Desulfofundulus thermosubterraneus DSM 16057]
MPPEKNQTQGEGYLAVRTVIELTRTMDLLEDLLARHFAHFNLSQPKFNALMELYYAGEEGLPLSELGQRMLVSRANITGLVDRLERDGLVVRVVDPKDRRVIRAQITPRAVQLIHGVLPLHMDLLKRATSSLNIEEKETLIRLLVKLQQGLDKL